MIDKTYSELNEEEKAQLNKEAIEWFDRLLAPCCDNEKRNMNGGCDNCGDPCI